MVTPCSNSTHVRFSSMLFKSKGFFLLMHILSICYIVVMISRAVWSKAAKDLEHKDMDAALCQNSRRRLFSVDEFQYLNVPHIELIMVYDDFECIFKCLYHPSCISVNLAAKGKLWCELLSSDKYSKPMEYKQNKSSHHYFIRSSYYFKTFQSGGVCVQSMHSVHAFKFFCEDLEGKFSEKGQCRSLVFKPAKAFDGQRLKNHVIRVEDVSERDFCGILCYMEPYCVSYNLGKQPRADDGKYTCELNNATHEGNKDDLVEDQSYIFGGAESACITNPCKNNAKCQSGFTDKGYRCMCPVGYKGLTCDEDIDECATREHSCSADGVCSNVKGSYKCGCKPGYSGDGRT
ncbi:fibulin-1-like, partial [Pocillopora damicornis]|uniref:fibulin-1-like n=1 Tax=Pocillopora damicornis TaxID=46731 RepID=UPI000F54DAA5